jgi:hypothetical protein
VRLSGLRTDIVVGHAFIFEQYPSHWIDVFDALLIRFRFEIGPYWFEMFVEINGVLLLLSTHDETTSNMFVRFSIEFHQEFTQSYFNSACRRFQNSTNHLDAHILIRSGSFNVRMFVSYLAHNDMNMPKIIVAVLSNTYDI